MVSLVELKATFDTSDVEKGTKKIELTSVQAAKATASLARQIRNLKKETRDGNLTARQYGAAVLELKKNFKLLSSGVSESLTVMNQFGVQATRAQSKMKRFGAIGAQQVGYQLQDFAVQVQGGTNALVALGQQGSQLLGIFGPAGALAGAALAIGTAILRPLLDAEAAAEQFAKNMKKTTEAVDKATAAFEDLGSAVGDFATDLNKISLSQFNEAMGRLGESAAGSFASSFMENIGAFLVSNLWTGFETWAEVTARKSAENFAESFGRTIDDFGIGVTDQFEKAIADGNIQELEDLISNLQPHLDNANESGRAFFEQMVGILEEMVNMKWAIDLVGEGNLKAAAAAVELKEEYGEAVVETLKLSNVDLSSNISSATIEAAKLVVQLGNAVTLADAFSRINLQSDMTYGGRGSGSEYGGQSDYTSEMGYKSPQDLIDEFNDKNKPKKSRSGAKSLDGMINSYEKLMDRLNGVDPLITKFNEEVKQLQKWQEAGAITMDQYTEATALLKKELEAAQDPLEQFRKGLEDALDPDKAYIKGLEALNQSLSDFLFDPFDKGLKGMVAGFAETLRRMASDALAAQIMKSMFPSGGGGPGATFMSMFGFAKGGAFQGGQQVTAFANGGVVNGPTLFPMANGAGLMGEAGPEAVMPLKRTSSGKLGVETSGGSAQPTSIKVINIDDRASIGKYLSSPAGEKIVLNVMRRNGMT